MADNVTLNAGSGGDTIAADDVGGAKYQRVKLSLGADGTVGDAPVGGGVESGVLRVTIASDSTGVLSVDDNGGSLTVDGTVAATQSGTWNVGTVTAVTAISNALPAGTNAIGKLAANSGVDIGDVDITSVTPGTTASSLGKAEDAAHTTGDVGVMSLAVRRDADTTLAGTDGDYAPLQVNAAGSLKVAITAGAGSGGTSIADGAGFTRDSTSVTPAGAVVESSAPTLTNGDAAGLSMTTGGALRVSVASGGIAGVVEDAASAGGEEGVLVLAVRRDAASSGVGTDGDFAALSVTSDGSLRVSGSSGTTQYAEDLAAVSGDSLCVVGAVRRDSVVVGSGTDGDYSTLNVNSAGRLYTAATVDAALPAGTNNIGDIDVLTVPADPFGVNADAASATGSISAKLRFIAATGIPVTGTVTVGSHAVTNAGTFVVQENGTQKVVDDAAFTPGTTAVVMAGFEADESSTDSVDEGDGGAARMTLDRKQIVTLQPHTTGGLTIFRSLDIDETEEDIKTSAGQVYFIHAMNMTATAKFLKFYNATAANVTVGSTTPVLTFPVPGVVTVGSGFTVAIPQGLLFDTAISVACTTGVADADTGAPGANEVVINIGYK